MQQDSLYIFSSVVNICSAVTNIEQRRLFQALLSLYFFLNAKLKSYAFRCACEVQQPISDIVA